MTLRSLTIVLAAALAFSPITEGQPYRNDAALASSKAVLWSDPGDIRSRDLFLGPGGKKHEPELPVKFLSEETAGSSPKFDVHDRSGKKWKAKLGPEARPEAVASRLLWAVGYKANDNYVIPNLKVDGLPAHLTRGDEFRTKDGSLRDVRLQRHPSGDDKAGTWSWRNNPFRGTREFNGLRVMMALIDNWDLKDANNARFTDKKTGEVEYMVTDVGASFGPTHRTYTNNSKGNLNVYRHARFITKIRKHDVDFALVGLPPILFEIFDPPYVVMELHRRWIGKHIPREDARWIGSLLAQLSKDQIRDAFRAADYPPDQIDGFVSILQARIAALQRL